MRRGGFRGPCIACKSGDAFRLHVQTGVAQCYSCGGKWSPFQVAEAVTGDREQAKNLLVEIGLFNPGPDGNRCTTFSMSTKVGTQSNKGLFAKGKPAGMFFPHEERKVRLPQPGETWHLVEGPKDAGGRFSGCPGLRHRTGLRHLCVIARSVQIDAKR